MTFLYSDDLCITSSDELGVMETPSDGRSHKMKRLKHSMVFIDEGL
jgi:hypothetical protein